MLQLKYGSSVGEGAGKRVGVDGGAEVVVGSGVFVGSTGAAVGKGTAGAQDARNNIVKLVISENRLILANSNIMLHGERYLL